MTLKNGFGKCSLFVLSAKENPNMEKALFICWTYDQSKAGDTRELQSRMVPSQNNGFESP